MPLEERLALANALNSYDYATPSMAVEIIRSTVNPIHAIAVRHMNEEYAPE
jgi:hypothetical protein